MSLVSGYKFTGFKWTQLPIPPEVIQRVNHLGKDQSKELVFFDRSGQPIADDNDAVSTAGVDGGDEGTKDDGLDIAKELQEISEQDERDTAIREAGGDLVELQRIEDDPQQFGGTDADSVAEEEPTTPVTTDLPVESTGVRRSTRNRTQPKQYIPSMKGKKYEVLFNRMQSDSPMVAATIMTQLSMKAGLKTWGDPAKEAVKEEMKQLHMRDTFRPRHWKSLTPEEKERL